MLPGIEKWRLNVKNFSEHVEPHTRHALSFSVGGKEMRTLIIAVCVAIVSGCVSERERQECVAAEKVRLDQIVAAEKTKIDRMEREAKEQEDKAKKEKVKQLIASGKIGIIDIFVKKADDIELHNAAVAKLVSLPATLRTSNVSSETINEHTDELPDIPVVVDVTMEGRRIRSVSKNEQTKIYVSKEMASDQDAINRFKQEQQAQIYLQERQKQLRVGMLLKDLATNGSPDEQRIVNKRIVEIMLLDIANSGSGDIKWLSSIVASDSCVEVKSAADKRLVEIMLRDIAKSDDKDWLEEIAKSDINDEAKTAADKRLVMIVLGEIAKSHDKDWLREIAKTDARIEIRTAASERLDGLEAWGIQKCHNVVKLMRIVKNDKREAIKSAAANRISEIREYRETELAEQCEEFARHDFNCITNGLAAIRSLRTDRQSNQQSWQMAHIENSYFSRNMLFEACKTTGLEETCKQMGQPWANVIHSRRGTKEEDRLRGDALLEKFGTSFMPNAFSKLEKTLEQVSEIQQMFNEEFPEPYNMLPSDPRWTAFEKILKGLMRSKVKYFCCRDELCHFYLMYKVGALTAEELSEIDSEHITIKLLSEMSCSLDFSVPQDARLKFNPLKETTCTFAAKSMPETYAIYQKCISELNGTKKLLSEITEEMQIMDIVRFDLCVIGCREKLDFTTKTINKLSADITGWHTEYKIMEKSASDIANLDHETAMKWKNFAELLSDYIPERATGPIVPCDSRMNDYYPCTLLSKYIAFAIGLNSREIQIRDDGYVSAGKGVFKAVWSSNPRRGRESKQLEVGDLGQYITTQLNSFDCCASGVFDFDEVILYSIAIPEYKENWEKDAVEIMFEE